MRQREQRRSLIEMAIYAIWIVCTVAGIFGVWVMVHFIRKFW